MTLEKIAEKYQIEDKQFLKEFLKWCKSQGWEPGTGRNDCTGCKYLSNHHNADQCCHYTFDNGKRRPCPPWDCTCYEPGNRHRKLKLYG